MAPKFGAPPKNLKKDALAMQDWLEEELMECPEDWAPGVDPAILASAPGEEVGGRFAEPAETLKFYVSSPNYMFQARILCNSMFRKVQPRILCFGHLRFLCNSMFLRSPVQVRLLILRHGNSMYQQKQWFYRQSRFRTKISGPSPALNPRHRIQNIET